MTTARPSPWLRRCSRTLVTLAVILLLPLVVAACGPSGGGERGASEPAPRPAATTPPLNGGQPRSAAQEAMVDRQLFTPQFPTAAPPASSLQAPLGDPGATPLGSGALFN